MPLRRLLERRALRKSKKILLHTFSLFRKKHTALGSKEKENLIKKMQELEGYILSENTQAAKTASKNLHESSLIFLKKGPLEKFFDLVIALSVALAFALVVRQTWFELYEIPTGSMRPTFKEKDRLTVSKVDFGINVPFSPSHFYFDHHLVQRCGSIVFTGEGMDIPDVDTRYFYLFPGKKLYVKRLMAKAEDTIYFYGGKIYGIDKEGNDISEQLNLSSLEKIDHIPFLRFEGKFHSPSASYSYADDMTIYQMNYPIVRLKSNPQGKIDGTLTVPSTLRYPNARIIKSYGDLWGIKNFAMARVLNRKQMLANHPIDPKTFPDTPLYLELRHDPNLENAHISLLGQGRPEPSLGIETSYIPLTMDHIEALFNTLYTARFEVKNGVLRRYGSNVNFDSKNPYLPHINGVADGCYEFYYGKAYQVLWQGVTKELPKSHPLYLRTIERLQLFFNLGLDFNTVFSPDYKTGIYPCRYAYFRDGNLFVMGGSVFDKNDTALTSFVKNELSKEQLSSGFKRYFPFVDHKPPLTSSGSLDTDFIKQYGLHIPAGMYLALGDNHAMSGDSREFGFVPSGNLRGGPSFIFWPPGSRFGHPNQPAYPLFVFPRIMIWGCAATVFALWYLWHRKRTKLPLKFP